METLTAYIRDIPDFPKPGILFKDITPLLLDPNARRTAMQALVAPFRGAGVSVVLGIEARGFIFGALVAAELGAGFVPLRKPGKLPGATHRVEYDLEYGSAALEMQRDALRPGDRALLIDDVLATGGTAAAGLVLTGQPGVVVVGFACLLELDFLHGRAALGECRVHSLLHY
ncbi:MAG: adenine phosphoribosyltransferase [Gammaproteobacteria bacterium]|nr:adenine phosphoribosyltransferase [Gammaproteobacteria bacterium]